MGVRVTLGSPIPLDATHRLEAFDSGTPSLNDWLRRRAPSNQASGAARTFVLCEESRVIGYYALASGALATTGATGRFRRNMPEPIPVVLFGRLAVDQNYQGRGLGRALFRDAARRVVAAADTIGIRGILVHAISDEAKNFYTALGFDSAPLEPLTLMITLNDLRAGFLAPKSAQSPG